jgi:phage tail-like protein
MGDEAVIPIAYTKVSFDSDAGGLFTSCTFPTMTLNSQPLDVFTQDGKGEKLHTNAILTFGDVTLTRGISNNKYFHDWAVTLAQSGMKGNTKDVTLDACDNQGTSVMTWSLSEAFIKSYSPGQGQAGATTVMTETVVLGFKEAKRTA